MSSEEKILNSKGQAAVKLANRQHDPLLSLKRPVKLICKDKGAAETMIVECIKGQTLKGSLHDWIQSFLEKNLKDMYIASSWGWNLQEKMKEVMEETAYLLIVRSSHGKPVGMSHFRFDMECGEEVVYCYEVQVEKDMQGRGIGKFLLNLLFDLAVQFNMRKTMLTVFKTNHRAYKLFRKLGFKIDHNSPKREFYRILSKPNSAFKE